MADLTRGQRAAAAAAKARRGDLRLTQRELADKAGVHWRTIQDFESGNSWPQAKTLAQIERLGLGWYAGKLVDMAAEVDSSVERVPIDPDPTTAELRQARQMLIDAIRLDEPAAMRELLADALGLVAKVLEQQHRSAS